MTQYDSVWKEALDRFLPAFLEFFFSDVHAAIDWSRRYQSLDKELQQITPDSEVGKRLADMLFKVWRRDGAEAWILIHVEVQNQPDENFAERMYVYNYRIFDRHHLPVVSLAVLGDEQPNWRPASYIRDFLGCKLRFEFPMVKLLDYATNLDALEKSPNIFAPIVLAHVMNLQTKQDMSQRYSWKVRIVKGLYERGLSKEEVRQLFRVIDWMMVLPKELELQFKEEIHRFEEEKKMPYVTSIERLAHEEGLEEGIEKGIEKGREEGLHDAIEVALEAKFGADGLQLMPAIRNLHALDVLRTVQRTIVVASSLDEVRRAIR